MLKYFLFFFSIILCFRIFAQEEKIIKVQAQGLGFIVSEDMALARETALNDARRRAMEEALGTFIESESIVQNYQLLEEKIYSRTQGFLKNEKIIKEESNNELYRITIEVDIGISNLEKDIQAVNLTLKRKHWPRVMILVKEKNIDEIFDPLKNINPGICEIEIIKKFKEKNFLIVERNLQSVPQNISFDDNNQIKELAQKLQAEILVVGSAEASSAGNILNTMMKSLQANVSIQAIKPDTGEIIIAASATGAKPHINEKLGGAQALQEASFKASDELIKGILEKLNQELNSTSRVELVLYNIEYTDISKITNILQIQVRASLASEVIQRSFENNRVVLELQIKGNAKNLADELIGKKFSFYLFKIKSVSNNKIEVEVVTGTK